MARVGELFSFTVGIEQILLDQGQHEDEHLPASTTLFPSDIPLEQHLEQALGSHSLERAVLASLRPEVPHRESLLPGEMRTQLMEAARELGSNYQSAKRPEEREELAAALRVLEEDKDLRDMLNAYRNLLVSG